MVEVKNLTKRYGSVTALDDVSFTADSGGILGLLGPNGAGKSTTMNIITGYISPSSGSVAVEGVDISADPKGAKAKIGYLPEIPPLYPDMTVRKYLGFIFELKKVRLPRDGHINEVMSVVGITEVADRLIKNLSKGYCQRVGLAAALIGNPPVLILDEPTVGLDPKQIIEIRKLIKALGKKHTVIFSSHILSEVSAVCDRVILIDRGRLVADAPIDKLGEAVSGGGVLRLEVDGSPSAVSSVLGSVEGVRRVTRGAGLSYTLSHDPDADIRRAVFRALAKADLPILSMNSGGLSLEESFLKLTEGGDER